MNKVFHASKTDLSESFLNDRVGSQRNSLFVQSSMSSLIYEILDYSSGRFSVSDPRFDSSEHVHGSFVVSDEHSVSDLSQSEQSHDSFFGRSNFSDTFDSDNQEKCRLFFNEETGVSLSNSSLFYKSCLLYTSPSPRDQRGSRMPSSA